MPSIDTFTTNWHRTPRECVEHKVTCCKLSLPDTLVWPMVQLWDLRSKRSIQTFTEQYQVVAVAFAEAGDQVTTVRCLSTNSQKSFQ